MSEPAYTRPGGRHLLLEMHVCDPICVSDSVEGLRAISKAVAAMGATPVAEPQVHLFDGGGYSIVQLLAESHISIHTWPEHNYAAADVFTCGDTDPREARQPLTLGLGAEVSEALLLTRGGQLPTQ